jgi:hypothetical protein
VCARNGRELFYRNGEQLKPHGQRFLMVRTQPESAPRQ